MLQKKIIPCVISLILAACFTVGIFNRFFNRFVPFQSEKYLLLGGITLLMLPILYLIWYKWTWRSLDTISNGTKMGWVVVSFLISWVIYTILSIFGWNVSPTLDGVSFLRRIILMGLEVSGIFTIWLPVFLIGTWLGMRETRING